ncbi:MAG: PEGA domain-containing protein [Planctomycetota bacterium]|nr:PEGA domain-containing protein [Planctomycetota bacterium]
MPLKSALPMFRPTIFLLLCSALFILPGCVERSLSIRTDPPGARVFVDGVDVGEAPVSLPFSHYGTRDVLVRMEEDDQRGVRSLAPQQRRVHLSPPWYQRFPIDIVSEVLWPGTIQIAYDELFVLEPQDLDALSERFRATAREHGVIGPLDDSDHDQR